MWNALNNPQVMDTAITIGGMVAMVCGLVVFYLALTYSPALIAERLRRKR
jgi:hypothetical protein